MRANRGEIKQPKIITFGGLVGGSGVTTVALCYAIEYARNNPKEQILFVGNTNEIAYILDIEPTEHLSPAGNPYSSYELGNINFSEYNKQMSAIQAVKPDLIIIDRGLILRYYDLKPNEFLVYCYPENHNTLQAQIAYKNLSNGKIIKFPLSVIHQIQSSLDSMPLTSMPLASELGKLILEQL